MDEPLILDRYRLLERLATGGSAEVWRAHDEQLDRPVAVKRLHPHLLPDEASRARLGAEARAAARLSHPVIVGVYDVDMTGEWPALVMELVDGESLRARIAAGPLPPREAASVAADLAEALYHAHQQGVIHRDVKPGNVLIGRDGRTRLVDFGIARSLAAAAAELTLTGTVVGTLQSMAPEQLAAGPITPRTDLYGLGVVLHEMLTGAAPYPTASPIALADAQRAGPPPLDGMDPALAAVVAGCLAHDPTDRPLHAGAVAAALRAWLAGKPDAALALAPPGSPPVDTSAITQPIPAVPAPDAALPPPAATAPRVPDSRRRPVAAILAIALVALLGLAGMAALNGAPAGTAEVPVQSASDAATPEPDWIASLAGDVAAACGDEAGDEAAEAMETMTEEEANEYAADLIAGCTERDDDGGGNGRGKGNGNGGNGNGNGRGGDD